MNLRHMALMRNVALTHVMIGNSSGRRLWELARDAHLEELEMYERGVSRVVLYDGSLRRIPRVPEKVLDEVIQPIFPRPIQRDTFTFKVNPLRKGFPYYLEHPQWKHEAAKPYINVGTIGHVDFARRPFEVCLQRSGLLYPNPSA